MKKARVWFKNLSRAGKILVVSAVSIITLGTAGAFAEDASPAAPVSSTENTKQPPAVEKPSPIVSEETKTEPVAFTEETREDNALPSGQTKIVQEGIEGERTLTYEVTTLEGKELSRKEIKNEVTRAPVNRVVLNGTYVAPAPQPQPRNDCDPNYSGACVPVASDVDCAGGSGNGPAYVAGPVSVVGQDIYDLDRDGNGLGCE